MNPSILLVDDDPAIRFGFSSYLSRSGYIVREASRLAEARQALLAQRFDTLILDLNLPDGYALDEISDLRKNHPALAMVVITGAGDVPLAVDAMRRGADHFICKPVSMEDLVVFLQKSLELGELRRRDLSSKRLEKAPKPHFGESPAMKRVLELASLAAASTSPCALLGETGTGKGVLARLIHSQSGLSSAAFVEVDCSNLRGEMLASELFGHAKGAFTSATQDRPGLVECADGGTLFMDEIGDMGLELQTQLLKVVEERQYRRLGEVKVRRSKFRLICATNRDLAEEVRHGRFRKDLFYRIYVFPIPIPPLRERTGDLPSLVRHLLDLLGAASVELPSEVMQLLAAYPWPGNIRELRNVLERALLLAQRKPLNISHFCDLFPSTPPMDLPGIRIDLTHSTIPASDGRTPYADSSEGARADQIFKVLKERPDGLTRSEISALFGRHMPACDIVGALNVLAENGRADQETTKTGGRPEERWYAKNPDVE